MLVCARTEHKAVGGSNDVVSIAVRTPFVADALALGRGNAFRFGIQWGEEGSAISKHYPLIAG